MDHPPGRRPLSGAAGAGQAQPGIGDTLASEASSGRSLLSEPLIPVGLDATLVLARHGESEYIVEGRFQGQAETPLSAAGRGQAGLLGARLARPHEAPALPLPSGAPRELVHSPLVRTRETAEAILRATSEAIAVRPDAGFLEIAQGEWEGLHRDDIMARYGEVLAAWRRTPVEVWAPGGEALPDVQVRVRSALARVLGRLAEGGSPTTVDRDQVAGYGAVAAATQPWSIVVGHDGVFKVALLTLFDLPLERFWMWTMDLCAITVVDIRAGRPVMRAHNLTGHLSVTLDEATVTRGEARSRSGAL